MTFESNRLKHSSGVRVRIRFWRYDRKAVLAGSQNALMLAHSCHQAHSNLASGIENLSTMRRAIWPAVPLGGQGNDTGGKDERLREHRIGHFRFQARGGCDCGGRTVFAIAFVTHDV